MGYGTGAIMAVPGHDERDFEFAKAFDLPIVAVVMPPDEWLERTDQVVRRHRPTARVSRRSRRLRRGLLRRGNVDPVENAEISIDGLPTAEAKTAITDWLAEQGLGRRAVNYKLRDWLFSRQRYWGEPFPIVLDEQRPGRTPSPSPSCRCCLPELDDFKPTGKPEPPLEQGDATGSATPRRYRRETNTMPQWAGSCWYYLRYLDPQERRSGLGPREGEVLDAGRPLRRRRRARGAAPALQPVLAQGALRPRARQHARAVPAAGQPGDDPGRDGVHRLPGRHRAAGSRPSQVEEAEHGHVLKGSSPPVPVTAVKLDGGPGRQEGRRASCSPTSPRSASTPVPTRCRRAGAT